MTAGADPMGLSREDAERCGIDWETGQMKAAGPGPAPAAPPPPAAPRATPRVRRLEMPLAMPPPLNALMRGRLRDRIRLGKDWRDLVAGAAAAQGLPPAAGPRRVGVYVTLPPRRRAADPDALHKAVGDALVKCGLLRGDSRRWVEWGPTRFVRGDELHTTITLQDIEDATGELT